MLASFAIEKVPERANEMTALMVMEIVGGGLVSAVLGCAQRAFGPVGVVGVLLVCLGYLFALGVCAGAKEINDRRAEDEAAQVIDDASCEEAAAE